MPSEDERERLKKREADLYRKENAEFKQCYIALCRIFLELCTSGGETPEARETIDDSISEAIINLRLQKVFRSLPRDKIEKVIQHLEKIKPLMRCKDHADRTRCRKQKFATSSIDTFISYLKALGAEVSFEQFIKKHGEE